MSLTRNRRDEYLSQSQGPTLRDEVNRLFDSFFGHAPAGLAVMREPAWTRSWVPTIDIGETDAAVTVTAELPGIKPGEVDINLTGHLLTLRGEKKDESDDKGKNWHRVERTYGTFSRVIALPESVDPERAHASYDNGVLTINIAKSEASRPRTIKIDIKNTK